MQTSSPEGRHVARDHSARAGGQKGSRAKQRYLNVIAYDDNETMPDDIRRQITSDYIDGLVGSAFSWEHADGDVRSWLSKCSSSDQLRSKVHDHPKTIGHIVDAFEQKGRLYATVSLKEGVKIPKPIADWMETSLSDICWPSKNGYSPPKPIELSGTSSAARPGCKVVSHLDPLKFRANMSNDALAALSPEQRAAFHSAMAVFDQNKDIRNFLDLVPEDMRDLLGSSFKNLLSGIEQARKLEQTLAPESAQTKAPPASKDPTRAEAAPKSNDPEILKLADFSKRMAVDQVTKMGVPAAMAQSYFETHPATDFDTIQPLLVECSKFAFEQARAKREINLDGPEPPTKMQAVEPSQDWRSINEEHMRMVRNYRGF